LAQESEEALMSRTKKTALFALPLHTTIGDLALALYEEAVIEFGNESIARRVASEALRDTLARARRVQAETDRVIEAA
jgi:exopolysaccharide biosynthesis predicted pyruvyltransferase EpsI